MNTLKMLQKCSLLLSISLITACSSSHKLNNNTPSVDNIMEHMDTNRDGKLSKNEVKGPLANDFSKVDTNSDGFISKDELIKAPKPKQGQRPPRK